MGKEIFLESERMIFRYHIEEDLEPFIKMQQDPDFRRYVGGKPRSRENAERKFRGTYLPRPKDDFALWATELKETGEYIGYCGISPHFSENGIVENEGSLAYYIAKEHWGKGLATEASVRFLDWAFKEKKLKRVVADLEEGNMASQRILENLGFRFVAREEGNRTFLSYELINKS